MLHRALASLVLLSLSCGFAILNPVYHDSQLVGVWRGLQITDSDSDFASEWTAYHHDDGTVEIAFTVTADGKTQRFRHLGTWRVEGDIYYSAISEVIHEGGATETVDWNFSYRILSLSKDTFRYECIENGDRYLSHRVE